MSEQPRLHQIAALPLRKRAGRTQILLITSRETKRWLIPKGWPMDGIADYKAAKIEAYEEAGALGRITKVPISHFEYVKRSKKGHEKIIRAWVYELKVTELKRNWPEKDERTRRWFSAEQAAELVTDKGLRAVIVSMLV